VWKKGHKESDPSNFDKLCIPVTEARLVSSLHTFIAFLLLSMLSHFMVCFTLQEKYKNKMIKRHGEGFNWQNESIDGHAVYASGGEKVHEW
jgi:hypothetical protein